LRKPKKKRPSESLKLVVLVRDKRPMDNKSIFLGRLHSLAFSGVYLKIFTSTPQKVSNVMKIN